MRSTIIELKNEDGVTIKYIALELEITTTLSGAPLTQYPKIGKARHEANKLNTKLANRRSDTRTPEEATDARIADLNARVEEVVAKVPSVASAAKALTVAKVEATPADELAAIAARVDGFDERIAALSAMIIEVIERAPEAAAAVTPYDDLVGIAARVAGVVSYGPLGEFGEPYEEATTFARNLLADALAQVPAVAEAVSFAEVEAAIATALAEVGISIAIKEEVTYIDSL